MVCCALFSTMRWYNIVIVSPGRGVVIFSLYTVKTTIYHWNSKKKKNDSQLRYGVFLPVVFFRLSRPSGTPGINENSTNDIGFLSISRETLPREPRRLSQLKRSRGGKKKISFFGTNRLEFLKTISGKLSLGWCLFWKRLSLIFFQKKK